MKKTRCIHINTLINHEWHEAGTKFKAYTSNVHGNWLGASYPLGKIRGFEKLMTVLACVLSNTMQSFRLTTKIDKSCTRSIVHLNVL